MKQLLIILLCFFSLSAFAQNGVDSTNGFPANVTTPMNAKFYKFMQYIKVLKTASFDGKIFGYDSVFLKSLAYLSQTPDPHDSSQRLPNTLYVDRAVAAGTSGARDTFDFHPPDSIVTINGHRFGVYNNAFYDCYVSNDSVYFKILDYWVYKFSIPAVSGNFYTTDGTFTGDRKGYLNGNNVKIYYGADDGLPAFGTEGNAYAFMQSVDGSQSLYVGPDSIRITTANSSSDTSIYKLVGVSPSGGLVRMPHGSGGTASLTTNRIGYGILGVLGSSDQLYFNPNPSFPTLGVGTIAPSLLGGYGTATFNGSTGGAINFHKEDTLYSRMVGTNEYMRLETLKSIPLQFSVKTSGNNGLVIDTLRKLQFPAYGQDTIHGTPVSYAAFDADGNVIEAAGGGSLPTTPPNGVLFLAPDGVASASTKLYFDSTTKTFAVGGVDGDGAVLVASTEQFSAGDIDQLTTGANIFLDIANGIFYTDNIAHDIKVGINQYTPDPSSSLDITSTTSGLLIPRMTEAQRDAISSPAESLLLYQNDGAKGFYYWDGAAYVPIAGGGWGITGTVATLTGDGSLDLGTHQFGITNGDLFYSENTDIQFDATGGSNQTISLTAPTSITLTSPLTTIAGDATVTGNLNVSGTSDNSINTVGNLNLGDFSNNVYIQVSGSNESSNISVSTLAAGGIVTSTAGVLGVVNGTVPQAGSKSATGTATTTFTVTLANTQANNTYQVNVTPTSALAAALFYVTNKTTTTFDVVYLAGLTGAVSFDYAIFPN